MFCVAIDIELFNLNKLLSSIVNDSVNSVLLLVFFNFITNKDVLLFWRVLVNVNSYSVLGSILSAFIFSNLVLLDVLPVFLAVFVDELDLQEISLFPSS